MDFTDKAKDVINPTGVCEPTGHLSSGQRSSPYKSAAVRYKSPKRRF